MNRPDVLNALSRRMFRDLTIAMEAAQEDIGVQVVTITGKGRAFSAGLDIREMGGITSLSEARIFVNKWVKPFWKTFLGCEKPVVSMVNGPAYGAGAEITLASDISIASDRSTFAFSGGKVGALCCIAGVIGSSILTGRKMLEMNLTGKPITAEEARQIGLVNYSVPEAELLSTTRALLNDLLKVSPVSNSCFKRIVRDTTSSQAFATAYRELANAIASPDFRKGSKAFTSKEIPRYSI